MWKKFTKKMKSETIIWQTPETDYWKGFLKDLIEEHFKETSSNLSKKIFENFDKEIDNFLQVCPKEMINKLVNPITLKLKIKDVS